VHNCALIHTHITIDHERVCEDCGWSTLLASCAHSTNHEDACILGLDRGELLRQSSVPTSSLKLEQFFNKALLLEVEHVAISRLRTQVVDTILIFMAEARTHRRNRGVQVLTWLIGSCSDIGSVGFGLVDSVSSALNRVFTHVNRGTSNGL